ncbi:MAG TPA: NAD(P)-dependent oxidoreductase [Candidatus Saccharimonadales bacterium]|nr:NAD(P)-dependent oxidoreductase [Candidatus Saccharimonadales bacterium]
MKTAWVTGAGGLIGKYLAENARDFAVIPLTHSELELTDFEAVEQRFRADRPQLIIHCAAMSKSPDCQANPALARKTNVEATAHLAALAAEIGFIAFSSDLVFDGRKGNYLETDAVNPFSIYAETKAEADQIVLTNPRHTVIRTSLNSGISPRGNSGFNEQLQISWRKGETLKLFFDEFRCPISAAVTARAVWELARQNRAGLYHLAGSERLSRVDIGNLAAARHPELNPRIEPCSLREYRGAPRPADTSLNCAKVQKLLSFPLPGLTQYLHENPSEPF